MSRLSVDQWGYDGTQRYTESECKTVCNLFLQKYVRNDSLPKKFIINDIYNGMRFASRNKSVRMHLRDKNLSHNRCRLII